MRKILKNASVLRMTSQEEGVINADIAIEGSIIAHIGEIPSSFEADEIIDLSNHLIIPGLINTHAHMAMSLLRNYADDLPLMKWLNEKVWPFEANLTGEDVYWGTMLSIDELIRSGCTTFNDMYFFMEDVAKAVEKTGIRANLSRGLVGSIESGMEKIEESKEFFSKWNNGANGRIRVDIAPHAPYTCTDDYIKAAVHAAEELGANIHIHLSESRDEIHASLEKYKMTPIERMDSIDLFRVKTNAAHCVHLYDQDFEILKKHNVSVLYNPSSNLKLGNGFTKVHRLLQMGINVSLGTDGSSSNNNLNMFEEMHLCGLVNKGFEAEPTVLPAYKVLEIATINGAKALGIDDICGSIEAGKKADLAIVDLNKPHLTPKFDLVAMLVYSAQGSDVRHVMCDGEFLMKDYKLLTFDEQEVIDMANKSAMRLAEMAKK